MINLDLLKERMPLRRAWETLGYDWPHRGTKVKCPFHEERTPSCHLDERKNRFKCFGCGVGGDVLALWQQSTGRSFRECLDQIASIVGLRPHEPVRLIPRQRTPESIYPQASMQAHNQVAVRVRKLALPIAKRMAIFHTFDRIDERYREGEISARLAIADMLRWRDYWLKELHLCTPST